MWERGHEIRREVLEGRKKSKGGGKEGDGFHVTGAQNGYPLAGGREPVGALGGKGKAKHENATMEPAAVYAHLEDQ